MTPDRLVFQRGDFTVGAPFHSDPVFCKMPSKSNFLSFRVKYKAVAISREVINTSDGVRIVHIDLVINGILTQERFTEIELGVRQSPIAIPEVFEITIGIE